MQEFIANGRVANIPDDAVGKTANGNVSFKFDFVCDSSLLDEQRRTYQYIAPAQIGGITFLETKTAAAKRRQSQQNVFAQSKQQQAQPFQAIPVDADEPF